MVRQSTLDKTVNALSGLSATVDTAHSQSSNWNHHMATEKKEPWKGRLEDPQEDQQIDLTVLIVQEIQDLRPLRIGRVYSV
jgi:hypothetical protein